MRRFLAWCALVLAAMLAFLFALSYRAKPERIEYGMTFSASHAEDLGLDWRNVYRAMLEDLGVKRLRLTAYWSETEPRNGEFAWGDLDFQLREARAHGASVILALGRRVPRWPECHIPEWAMELSWEEEKKELREYLRAVVERYKEDPTIIMWQVENEPFLRLFADEQCGSLDETFLDEEIALLRSLDSRPVLLTDSGNLGTWVETYSRADVFGTSVYLYFWNKSVGAFRTILPPAYYRIKANLVRLFFGERPIIVSELSLEPWLAAHANDVPLEEQLSRMSVEKFHEIIAYAKETRFGTQYLWGVEWWYYMKERGHAGFWEAGRVLLRE